MMIQVFFQCLKSPQFLLIIKVKLRVLFLIRDRDEEVWILAWGTEIVCGLLTPNVDPQRPM